MGISQTTRIPSLLLFFSLLVAGCAYNRPSLPIPTMDHALASGKKIIIRLHNVDLELQGRAEPALLISGSSFNPQSHMSLVEIGSTIYLDLHPENDPALAKLMLRVPHYSELEILQTDGQAYLHDYQGNFHFESLSADVRGESLAGEVWLISRRGSIEVAHSTGEIHALVEAGTLTFIQLKATFMTLARTWSA